MEKSVTAFFSYLVVVGVASWRTICPGAVRMFDPVGTEEKHGFDAATSEAFDTFQSILKIRMLTVQVNGNEMAWVCENFFGTEPNVQSAYSIETFSWTTPVIY